MRMSAIPAWTSTSAGPWPSTRYASWAVPASTVGIAPRLRADGGRVPESVGPLVLQLARRLHHGAHPDVGEAAADRDPSDARLREFRHRRRVWQREDVHRPVDRLDHPL